MARSGRSDVAGDFVAQPASRELARQILARDLNGANPPTAASAAAAAEQSFHRLSDTLGRWVGAEGSQALFSRALALAQAQNPALRVVPPPARSALFLDALAASAPHDADALTDGVVTIMTTLIELLGRLIGHDLALMLVTDTSPGQGTGGEHRSDAGRAP